MIEDYKVKRVMDRRKRRQRVMIPLKIRNFWLVIIFCAVTVSCIYACYANKTKSDLPEDIVPVSQANDLLKTVIPNDIGNKIINYIGFTVSFNPSKHQPNYVAWELTGSETEGLNPRAKCFAQDYDVEGCATLEDYHNSGYDRGHMAPSGDMKWDSKAMSDCFMMTNMCPQRKALNSGAWKTLEEKCRQWAKRDSALIIVCGPVLSDRMTETIGDSEIPVPLRFFKVVLAPFASPPRAIGFIMNNSRVEGGIQAAATSVDEVERVTGFDFFSALPDDIEDKVESESNFHLWNRKLNR